jgi:uncharacterized protein (DUF1697 family)
MTTHIALLRAVNVGGRGKLAMSDLRKLAAGLGFDDVRSLLQSGNLVFRCGQPVGCDLERLLEAETAERLGVATEFFVRSPAEWADVIGRNPFREAAERDPGHLLVMFLKGAASSAALRTLNASIAGPETIHADGRQLYIVYPAGIARSRLTSHLIESRLGTRGTGRNWNTVRKLAVLAGATPV